MSMTLNAWHHKGGGHLFAESHSPRNFLQSGWTVSFQASPQYTFFFFFKYTFNSIAVPIKMLKRQRGGGWVPRGWGWASTAEEKSKLLCSV